MAGSILALLQGISCGANDAALSPALGDAAPIVSEGGALSVGEASDGFSSAGEERGVADLPEGDDAGASDAYDSSNGQVAADANGSSISLTLCLRLDDPQRPAHTSTLSLDVEQTYLRSVYLDCDVAKMVVSDEDTLSVFQNALVSWNLSFWGCRAEGTNLFGILRDGFGDMTSTDAARLVDHYVAATNQVLLLSPGEELAMREALARLSGPAIARQADEFSLSTCAAGDDAALGDDSSDGPGIPDESSLSDSLNPASDGAGGSE